MSQMIFEIIKILVFLEFISASHKRGINKFKLMGRVLENSQILYTWIFSIQIKK